MNKLTTVMWATSAFLMGPSSILAAEWSLTSNLNPSIKYDDNVFLSEQSQGSVQYAITPSLNLKREMENSEISLETGYGVNRYASLSRLDRADPFTRFKTKYSTERSTYGLDASYQEASSRSTAEQDSGDFATESTVTKESVSPSYSYKLSERDTLGLTAAYSKSTYSTADFSDTTTKSISSNWQHAFSERFSGGLSLSFSNYDSQGLGSQTQTDNYNLSTTASFNLSELWKVNGQIGIRQLKSDTTNNTIIEDNQSSGSSFDINIAKQSEISSVALGLSRSISPSNTGDVNEQDRFNVSWSRMLSEYLTTSLSFSYQQSRSATDENNSSKRENINFSPLITWQFDRNLGLNVSYNYRQQKLESDNTNVRSNSLMIGLIYDWDGIRVSR